jgi:hypothetical protein
MRVLIVEDEALIALHLQMIVTELGYEVSRRQPRKLPELRHVLAKCERTLPNHRLRNESDPCAVQYVGPIGKMNCLARTGRHVVITAHNYSGDGIH